MAYAPPPGTASSLPARPPVSNNRAGFRSAFGAAAPAQPYPAAAQLQPPAASAAQYGTPPSHYPPRTAQYGASSQFPSAGSYAAPSYAGYPGGAPGVSSSSAQGLFYPAPQHQHQQPQPQHQRQQSYASHNQGYGSSSYAAPHIQNPFPMPGTAASGFEQSEAAQIAEWQSAYSGAPSVGKDGKPVPPMAESPKPEVPAVAVNAEKKKTVVRQGGGKKWTDDTLLEWDPSHLRLFVGNLAGETTDESLLKAFSRWRSVQKARVVRDKRTTKSKGYGFVSFSDADDFFQAAKEMNGKYIQSHPVVIRKANTEIKVTKAKERGKPGKNNNSKNRSGNQQGAAAAGYEPGLGPMAGGGVTKPGQKTKNGLRLLG